MIQTKSNKTATHLIITMFQAIRVLHIEDLGNGYHKVEILEGLIKGHIATVEDKKLVEIDRRK